MITVENFTIAKVGDVDPHGVTFDVELIEYLVNQHGDMMAGYYMHKGGRNTFQPYDISHFTSCPVLVDDELQCTLVIADTPRGRMLQEAYKAGEVDFRVVCEIALVTRDGKAQIGGIKHVLGVNHDLKTVKTEEAEETA